MSATMTSGTSSGMHSARLSVEQQRNDVMNNMQRNSDNSNDSCASETDSNDSSCESQKHVRGDTKGRHHDTVSSSTAFGASGSQASPSSSLMDSSSRGAAGDKRERGEDESACGDGEEPSVKRKRRPRAPTGMHLLCAVCGDTAFGYNFDALSCESCKAFFRRNAMRQHVCQNGNQCKIDKESRKYCSSCRLTKCLQVGMKRELILTPAKLEKRAKLVRKKCPQSNSGNSTCIAQSQVQHACAPMAQPGPARSLAQLQTPRPLNSSTTPSPLSCSTASSAACEAAVKYERTDDSPYSVFDVGLHSPAYAAVMMDPRLQQSAAEPFSSNLLARASGAMSMQPEAMLTEMARLGLDVSAVASASSSHRHSVNGPLATSCVSQVKQEFTHCASDGSSRTASEYCAMASTLPAVEYDQLLAKCASACEQLLRPLNANDMRQMRPAIDAYEQFNYGELFVRRFVSAFKQLSDFRTMGPVAQLKLLRSSMVSTLNIAGVFSFDVSRQAWVLQVENCPERVYLINDMVALFESSGQAHIRDYMRSYCEFHTQLRNEFGDDMILFFVLILIDMFSPHRFTTDRDMLAQLVPAHARYVQFLELYLSSNYGPSRSAAFAGPRSSSEPVVKQKLDFCLDMLSNARTLEEYLAITSQYIGLSAMLPLLAEVCEHQLNENSDVE